jgi:hypothetical protein
MYEDIIKTAAAKGHGLGSEQLEPIIANAIQLAIGQATVPATLLPALGQAQPIPKDPELVLQLEAANKEIDNLHRQLELQKPPVEVQKPSAPSVKPAIASAKPKAHKPKHRY